MIISRYQESLPHNACKRHEKTVSTTLTPYLSSAVVTHLQAAWCKLWSSTLVQQTVSYLKLMAIVCRNSETESCMEECCSQEMSVLFYCLKFKCLKIPPKTLPGSEHFKGPWNSAETASSLGGCLQGTNLPPTTFHRNCRKSGKPGKKGISIIF